MPKKPSPERPTDNPLGRKIQQVMRDKGQDFKALAEIFQVSVPSVYDWIDHGRLSKERYQQLVKWSGKSLDWWFDIETPGGHKYPTQNPTQAPAIVAESLRQYGTAWPFPAISPEVYFTQLSEFERGEIQGFARAIFRERHADGQGNGTEG
jgi:hypothetical protein